MGSIFSHLELEFTNYCAFNQQMWLFYRCDSWYCSEHMHIEAIHVPCRVSVKATVRILQVLGRSLNYTLAALSIKGCLVWEINWDITNYSSILN